MDQRHVRGVINVIRAEFVSNNNNNNFLIDVPFKVIFLGLNILGAAIDLLLAAFRGVSL